jgi:hypothetical protein
MEPNVPPLAVAGCGLQLIYGGATQFGNVIDLSGSTGKLANDNCDGKSAVISL